MSEVVFGGRGGDGGAGDGGATAGAGAGAGARAWGGAVREALPVNQKRRPAGFFNFLSCLEGKDAGGNYGWDRRLVAAEAYSKGNNKNACSLLLGFSLSAGSCGQSLMVKARSLQSTALTADYESLPSSCG